MAEQERASTGRPLVTVAMPIYNAGIHLRLAVLSVVAQTFIDWELLIIDDGSTDNAIASIADISDARIQIRSDGLNKGLAARLNQAIDLARGAYLVRMDQDDVCHPERFARQLSFMEENPEVDLVGARCVTVSESGELLGCLPWSSQAGQLTAKPWLGLDVPHPTWFGRLEWFRRHRYASPGPYCCEDQELLLRTYASSEFYIIPSFLLAYRLRDRPLLRKAFHTRKTLLGVQARHFFAHGQYGFLLLATCAFLGRLLKDLVVLVGITTPVRDIRSAGKLGTEDRHFWKNWVNGLASR